MYDNRLHVLARIGKISLVARLIKENGLDIHELDEEGLTALHIAAAQNKPKSAHHAQI
jgi:ankyrin repeat protein